MWRNRGIDVEMNFFVSVGLELTVENGWIFGKDIVELTLKSGAEVSACLTNLLKIGGFVVCWEDGVFGVEIIGRS